MATKIMEDATLQFFTESVLNRELIPDEMLQALVMRIYYIIKHKQDVIFDDDLLEFCDIVNNYWRLDKCRQTEDTLFVYQMGRLLSCVTLLTILYNEVN